MSWQQDIYIFKRVIKYPLPSSSCYSYGLHASRDAPGLMPHPHLAFIDNCYNNTPSGHLGVSHFLLNNCRIIGWLAWLLPNSRTQVKMCYMAMGRYFLARHTEAGNMWASCCCWTPALSSFPHYWLCSLADGNCSWGTSGSGQTVYPKIYHLSSHVLWRRELISGPTSAVGSSH